MSRKRVVLNPLLLAAMEDAYENLKMACGYSSTLAIPEATYGLPGLNEIHVNVYTPMTYHLTTARGVAGMLPMAEGEQERWAMQVRMLACLRKTEELLPKAVAYYEKTVNAADKLRGSVRGFAKRMLKKQGVHGRKIKPAIAKSVRLAKRIVGKREYDDLIRQGKQVDARNKGLRKKRNTRLRE